LAVAVGTILFVPGSRPDRFAKALASGADIVCLDLEDAVAADSKAQARESAVEALEPGDSRIAVRINGLETAHGLEDLLALKESGRSPGLLFVPMVESPRDIAIVASVLNIESPAIVPLVETAAGLRAAHEIAAAPGVAAMMFGGRRPVGAARSRAFLGAAGRGARPVHPRLRQARESRPSTCRSRGSTILRASKRSAFAPGSLGFTAKAAIHPGPARDDPAIFMPSEAELSQAHEALERIAPPEEPRFGTRARCSRRR
jgi:citrate lyase beta subunit